MNLNPPVESPIGTGINIELFFRFIYDCITGKCVGTGDFSVLFATIWQWIVLVGYTITILGLVIIVYAMVRLYELRKREEEQLETVIVSPESGGPNPRWVHIESLMEKREPASWRQAIIEADIILDEMLTRQGYQGSSVGEKLKQVERSDFDTLQDAWEAHKVRNEIAHTGAAFDLSEVLARRTMARYEAVFREFKFI